jgi:hypothetical protein
LQTSEKKEEMLRVNQERIADESPCEALKIQRRVNERSLSNLRATITTGSVILRTKFWLGGRSGEAREEVSLRKNCRNQFA